MKKPLALHASLTGEDGRDKLKELIASIVERAPVARTCRIHDRIAAERGNFVASPRGFEPRFTP